MANQIGSEVSAFTPVASIEHPWIQEPAWYLMPFGGRGAIAVPYDVRDDGSIGARPTEVTLEWYQTAIIIASYVLTLGIAPLLAAIATVVIRCYHKFHWIEDAAIDLNQPDQFAPNPAIQTIQNQTDIWTHMGEMGAAIKELQLSTLQLQKEFIKIQEREKQQLIAEIQQIQQMPIQTPDLEQRPTMPNGEGNRLGGEPREDGKSVRELAGEAAEARLRALQTLAEEPKPAPPLVSAPLTDAQKAEKRRLMREAALNWVLSI